MNSGPVFDLMMVTERLVAEFRAQHRASGGPLTANLVHSGNLQRTAQDWADKLQSGMAGGVIPMDTRNPLERAKATDIGGSSTMEQVHELWGWGDTSPYPIFQAWTKNPVCCAALLDDMNMFGVGVGGGRHSLFLVLEIGKRPSANPPESWHEQDIEPCFTATDLLTLPGSVVQVGVTTSPFVPFVLPPGP